MKKYFILAVAAVVALAACSKTEADKTAFEQNRVINFNTVTKKATKAPISGPVYTSDLPAFGVFAYYLASGNWNTTAANSSAVSYMSDVEVAFDDDLDIWAPSTTYYWPLEGNLTFIAYSPKTAATATFSNAGVLTLTGFTVNTTVASQVDLLYSAIAADKTQNESYYVDSAHSQNSETAEGDKGVNIVFKHALSQVIFKAKTADDVYAAGLSFKINSITVNAASTATSMTVTNPTTSDAAADITTWNAPASPANYLVNTTAYPNATVATGAANFLTNTLAPATAGEGIGDPLLMIPSKAEVTPATNPVSYTFANDPTVTINYTLYRLSDAQALGSNEVTVHFNEINDVVKCWEAGKKYVYNLTIDLQKIYFNPSVEPWEDGGSQDVDVPDDAA
ncbi:MAG: fimbrillin family protein [Bacteroidales bacterium]|nr:fimbrillin family protein [Bacteroidales bacterium]